MSQPSDGRDEERPLPSRRLVLRYREEVLSLLERTDNPRKYAGQCLVGAIQPYRLSECIQAPAKTVLPEAMAHDDRP
jgi:hypothetical protein